MVRAVSIQRIVLTVILATLFSLEATAAPTTQCFSDMNYHKVEADYVGFNICLMEHRGGVSVVFQEAAGMLEAPLLIEGEVVKGKLRFQLPDSALTPGTWEAVFNRQGMVVTNPVGNVYQLKKKSVW